MSRVLTLVPLVIISLAALFIVANWDQFPTDLRHYSSPRSALLALGILGLVWLVCGIMAWFQERKRFDYLSPEDARRLAAANGNMHRLYACLAAGIMAFQTAIVPYHPELKSELFVVAFSFGVLALAALAHQRVLSQLKIPATSQGELYNNPQDKRLWVPSPQRVGYRLNYGHPYALWVIIALLALVGGGLLLALVGARR